MMAMRTCFRPCQFPGARLFSLFIVALVRLHLGLSTIDASYQFNSHLAVGRKHYSSCRGRILEEGRLYSAFVFCGQIGVIIREKWLHKIGGV